MKRFTNYIKEDVSTDFVDMKQELSEMIQKSTNSTDNDVISEFIESYLEDPESTQIEGLINSSDIYEFYLKFSSDIDEICLDLQVFDKSPSSVGQTSLFDYSVWGTQEAVIQVVEQLKNEGLPNEEL